MQNMVGRKLFASSFLKILVTPLNAGAVACFGAEAGWVGGKNVF